MAEYCNGDRFYIDENRAVIVCDSKSGETYNINEDRVCDCKGFAIRQECRHVKEATILGMFDKLESYQDSFSKDLFCRMCGSPFDKEDRFCGHCGKKRIG